MGLIRGILLVFVCVLLFVSFFLMGTFATLDSSLSYETIKPQIKPLLRDTLDFTPIYNYESVFENYCVNSTEYVYPDVNHTFVLPCNVVANGTEAIIDYQLDILIEDDYHKEYDCKFWNCFKETGPFFLVSQYAQDYWRSKFYNFLIISILLAGLVFLLVEKKINFPILTGVLLVVSFIPVSVLDSIGKVILKIILSSMKSAVDGLSSIDLNAFVLIFFSQANNVFLTGLVIGLALIAVGILLKIFKFGFKINKLFGIGFGKKKDSKEESEIEKKNKKGEVALE